MSSRRITRILEADKKAADDAGEKAEVLANVGVIE